MSEQTAPVPDDARVHPDAAAEGETTDVESDAPSVREHSTDPAEGA